MLMPVKRKIHSLKQGFKRNEAYKLECINYHIRKKNNIKDVLNKIANNFHVNYQVSEFYDVWGMVNFLCKKT